MSIDSFVSSVSYPCNDRILGIRLSLSLLLMFLCIFPVILVVLINSKSLLIYWMLVFHCILVLFIGDFNADVGSISGPSANEQGKILKQYLCCWNYVSVHIQSLPYSEAITYLSEVHGPRSCIVMSCTLPVLITEFICVI